MRKIPKHIILNIFLFFTFAVAAQNTSTERNIEAILESVVENLDEESGVAMIVEDLEELLEDPLNINTATPYDFSRLHLLNEIQIQQLLNYRVQFGPVFSLFELNALDGFTPELLKKIESFIWFGPVDEEQQKLSEVIQFGRHQFLVRSLGTAQIPKGFHTKEDRTVPYEGNRFRFYSRYRFEAGDRLSVGLTGEKDPGEAFFTGSNKHGFDFYSGHFSVKINPLFENVTVGDFWVRSGQGLVLWQGFSMGKSLNAIDIFKTGQGIRPFSSTDENFFFRGVASTLNFADFKINLFYSNKKTDANLVFMESEPIQFSSLQTSGYHRTQSEIEDKHSVRRKNWGANVAWQRKYLKIGTTFITDKFEFPFIRSEQLYNKFRFTGTQNFTTGVDYLYSKGKYQIFGEAAISKSKGKAFLQGAILHLNDRLNLSLLYRNFDKNYHALWASPFAEGSSAENESGMYFGTQILPVKYVSLSAYSDYYRSNWITFNTAAPLVGHEVFVQADFKFPGKTEFYIRFKNEIKDRKILVNEIYINRPGQVQKIRFHFKYKFSDVIISDTRLENVLFKSMENEYGNLFYQEFQFAPVSFPLKLSARVTLFDTKSFNSVIYAYEKDLLYTFSIPGFYGKGWRAYVNLKYKISKNAEVWFKLGNTFYNNRETISSGYNEISGNQKTELKFQFRLKI